jgi:plastocyanin
MKRAVIAISWIFVSLMIYFILDANAPNKNELYPAAISGLNLSTSTLQTTSSSGYIQEPRAIPPDTNKIDFLSNPNSPKKDQASQEKIVYIKNLNFDPNNITIKKGDKITWINMDQMQHTATSVGKFDSGVIAIGQSYSKVFTESGQYDYTCTLHSSMKGKIIVE